MCKSWLHKILHMASLQCLGHKTLCVQVHSHGPTAAVLYRLAAWKGLFGLQKTNSSPSPRGEELHTHLSQGETGKCLTKMPLVWKCPLIYLLIYPQSDKCFWCYSSQMVLQVRLPDLLQLPPWHLEPLLRTPVQILIFWALKTSGSKDYLKARWYAVL